MQIRVNLLWAILLGFIVSAVACSEKTPQRFLLPELTEDGVMLSEVTISTLPDPQVAQGPAAVVYHNPLLTGSGFDGSPATPQLAQSGEVWVPLDALSSAALAVYYGFEKIKLLEDRLIPEFSSRLNWPRKVAIDLQVAGGGFDNNAFYAADSDVTAVTSYQSNGLPISFNSGILAHEHFHAHFHRMVGGDVIEQMDHIEAGEAVGRCGFKPIPSWKLTEENQEFKQLVNFVILRGWNEGLADYYGFLVTGLSNFFDESLKQDGNRDLKVSPFDVVSRRSIENDLRYDLSEWNQQPCLALQRAYALGTQLARKLYFSLKNPEDPQAREAALKKLFAQLDGLKNELILALAQGEPEVNWLAEKLLMKETPIERQP